MGAGQTAIGMAQNAAAAPFQQPVAPVAGFTPFQQQGFGATQAALGMAQPYFNQGQGYLQQSAAPVSGTDVANYYNPMASNVTAQMQNIFGQQQRNTTGQLTAAAGGVGADRIAVGQSELANQQSLAAGQTYAGLYQQALQAAQQQKQMEAGAGYGISQMGPAAQGAQLQGIQALMGAGGMQQNLTQQQMNAQYQNQLARIAYPFQTAQYLAGITGGLAGAMGGTTTGNATTTYPTPSPFAQALGLGTAGIGAMGSMGMFGGGTMGSLASIGGMNGAGTQGMGGWYQRGGRAMADGGDVEPQITFPGASTIPMGGSPVPTLRLPMTSGKSGPGGEFMQMHDLPMQPPGMPQKQQGQAGTSGDVSAATNLLNAMGSAAEAQGGAVEPMSYGQGFDEGGMTGGELGEVFPNTLAQDANPTPTESDTGLFKPDVMPPDPPMGGGPMAGAGVMPPPLAEPSMGGGPGAGTGALPQPQPPLVEPPMGGGAGAGTGALPQPPTSGTSFAQRFPFSSGPHTPFAAIPNEAPPIAGQSPEFNAILDRAAAVTRGQETGGVKGDPYSHVTTTTNRRGQAQHALGAYQIMDFNLLRWSKEAFGREVSPQEFLANPKLQDALYRYKMGNYLKRYGAEGAGRAWLGGEGGVNAPMATDPFGTRVGDYGRKFAAGVNATGSTGAMVAGPGAPSRGDRLDVAPGSPSDAGPRGGGPMGSSDFKEPYPDALNRDWGQRATRSPWMSLVKAGAQMATTVGPIGSVIGQGIKAGAGELDEQRKALTNEEAINQKAKALHDTANYHLDLIAARRENSLVRLSSLTGLHASQIVKIQHDVMSDPIWSLRPREEQEAEITKRAAFAADELRKTGAGAPAGGAPAAAVAGAPTRPADAPEGSKWAPSTKMWYSPDGSKRWDAQGNPVG